MTKFNKVEATLKVSEEKNQLISINGEIELSAEVYDVANKITGLSVIPAETIVLEDGRKVGNPYIERDDRGIRHVISKQIAFGYSPQGVFVVSPVTVAFSPETYLLNDLMSTIANDEEAGKVVKKTQTTKDELEKYMYMDIRDGWGILADPGNVNVLHALNQYTMHLATGDRKVQTIARKLAMKKHPALAGILTEVTGQEGFREGIVKVVGFFNISSPLQTIDLNAICEGSIDIIKIKEEIVELDETQASIPQKPTDKRENIIEELKRTNPKIRDKIFKKKYAAKYKKIGELNTKELENLLQEIMVS